MAGGWRSANADIQPVENVTWSSRMGLIGFALGIGAWTFVLLLWFYLPLAPYVVMPRFLLDLLIYSLLSGLPIGAASLLLLGFRGRVVREKFTSNGGIRRSLLYSLLGAGAFKCFALLIWTAKGTFKYQLWGTLKLFSLTESPEVWLGLTYMAWLCSGGHVVIRRVALRTILVCQGVIPVRYNRFLEYATSLIFLQRTGASYIFIHRSLMEHFAKRAI